MTIVASRPVASGAVVASIYYWDVPVMTATNAPSPNMITALSSLNSSFLPWYPLDGSAAESAAVGSSWVGADNTMPSFWRYDAGAGNSNLCRELILFSGVSTYPNAFKFQGSTNGSDWADLASGNGRSSLFTNLAVASPAYYRFYQLNISSVVGAYPRIHYIYMSSAYRPSFFMTSDLAPSPYAANASSTQAVANAAWKAFDNNPLTFWYTTAAGNQWIKQDLGSNTVINGVTIGAYATVVPKDFVFDGSTDDSTWTTLQNGTMSNNENYQHFTNANVTPLRYYRLTFTNRWSANIALYSVWFKKY